MARPQSAIFCIRKRNNLLILKPLTSRFLPDMMMDSLPTYHHVDDNISLSISKLIIVAGLRTTRGNRSAAASNKELDSKDPKFIVVV